MYVQAVLKQKIRAGGIKIKRYDERCQQFKLNQLFRSKKKLFYEALGGKERGETELPEPMEAITFGSGTWSEEGSHNDKVSSLEDVKQEFRTTETQEHITITEDIRN